MLKYYNINNNVYNKTCVIIYYNIVLIVVMRELCIIVIYNGVKTWVLDTGWSMSSVNNNTAIYDAAILSQQGLYFIIQQLINPRV